MSLLMPPVFFAAFPVLVIIESNFTSIASILVFSAALPPKPPLLSAEPPAVSSYVAALNNPLPSRFVANSLISVSYTHLTLPTNREV